MAYSIIMALLAASAPGRASDPLPLHPLAAYVSDADYPASAIRREASGTVTFTLDVDAAGAPTRCTVTGHADPDLDRATCDVFMSRARFEPARDRRGRAVPGTVSSRLRWVLPDPSETAPLVAMRVTAIIERDRAGNLTCAISANGSDRFSRPVDACGFLAGSGAAVALGRSGAPGAVIADYVMLPEGSAPAPGAAPSDAELAYEDVAHVVITPDGNVAACRENGPTIIREVPGLSSFHSICPPQGMRFDTTSAGVPQEADISLRVYLRSLR